MRQCSAVAVFFGPGSEGRWQSSEENLALDIAISSGREFPVIPVLLPGAVKSTEHTFLTTRTWVEFPALENAEALRQFICGIENRAPGPPPSSESDDLGVVECPYVGLTSFGAAQASYFFGRTEVTAALVERIRTMMLPEPEGPRLLGLVGGSGTGKSSLARAGVLHMLGSVTRTLDLCNSRFHGYRCVVSRPYQ